MTEYKKYPEEDYWDDFQIELVNDRSIKWEFKIFKVVSGFWIERNGQKILGQVSQHQTLPDDAIIEENVWDHEHCELCNDTIMEGVGNINGGYTDGKQWICPEC